MDAALQTLLANYTEELKKIYQQDLHTVILYGSYARGDYGKESDIDIMILVNTDENSLRKRNKDLVYMTYDFNLDNDIDIQPIAESSNLYRYWSKAHPLYQNINREGIVLYHAVEQ